MSSLSLIKIEPSIQANASIIWLHGLGASGDDFASLPQELNLPEQAAIRFVFPNAPEIPVTVNANYVMPAWYDILALTEEREINERHLLESVDQIHQLIQRELDSGIASERIIIAGFSQGGAVAYHAALTFPKKLGAVLALSTYFPTVHTVSRHAINQGIPIAIFHGSNDPMVLCRQGEKAYKALVDFGYQASFQTYPIEHELCLAEIRDISAFIQKQLL
jgi:phospholipase/carboxylesterase